MTGIPSSSAVASSAPVASVASGLGNVAASIGSYFGQKALMKQQNEMMWDNFRRAGATPAAIAAGVTGNASSPSAPSVSTGGNPFPDVGSSVIGQQNANTQQNLGESETLLNLMKLRFEPSKYYAEINKALTEAFKNTKEALMFGSLKENYDELNKDLRLIRPWKLNSAIQSFLNLTATYDNIVQDTSTKKSEEYRNYAQGAESYSQVDLNKALEENSWQDTYNKRLDQFKKQWELDLLAQGIDPNQPFWENTKRLMYTNPEMFKARMNGFVRSLQILDGKIKENLGDNYIKKGIGIYGAYRSFDFLQKAALRSMPLLIGAAAGSPAPVLGFANRGLY